jgi:hypothetical protein
MLIRHKICGETVEAQVTCSECGEPLHADEVRLEPGPGAKDAWGTRDVELLRPRRKAIA